MSGISKTVGSVRAPAAVWVYQIACLSTAARHTWRPCCDGPTINPKLVQVGPAAPCQGLPGCV